MRAKFSALDKDGTGMLSVSEIKEYIKTHHENIFSNEEISNMMEELDSYGNGKINYSEFLAATVDVSTFLTEEKMMSVFAMFDTDGSGKITETNMTNAFSKLGMEVPKEEVHAIMLAHDLKSDGVLSLEEFKSIFSDRTKGQN